MDKFLVYDLNLCQESMAFSPTHFNLLPGNLQLAKEQNVIPAGKITARSKGE